MAKQGKIDFVQSAVAKIAQGRPMLPVVPMEKRVLMDAVLEWDIGGLDHVTTLISSIHDMLDSQLDSYSDFLDRFDNLTGDALDALDILADAGSRMGAENESDLVAMIDNMRGVVTQIKTGSLSMLDDLVGAGNTDYDAALETAVQNSLRALVDPVTHGATIDGAVTSVQMAATFNLAAFTSNTLDTKIDTLVSSLSDTWTTIGISAGQAKTAIQDAADTYFETLLVAGLSIDLTDISVNGQKVVDFTQRAGDLTQVDVSVILPSFGVDLDRLLDIGLDGVSSPVSLSFDGTAGTIDFVLGSHIAKTGNVVDSIGINITDFDFGTLFQVGGTVTVNADDVINLGLLSSGVTSLQTAELRGMVVVDPVLNLGGQINLTTAGGQTLGPQFYATNPALDIDLEIKELGSTTFAAVTEETEYDLLAVNLGGTLGFFTDAADGADSDYSYTAAVTVSSVLIHPTISVAQFIRDAKIGFDVDFAGVSDPALRDKLETSVESLAAIGIDQVTGFFTSIGNLVADVLDAVTLDVDIPFTDIEIRNAITEINDVFTGLAKAFVLDPVDLGYGDSQPTMSNLVAGTPTQSTGAINFTALATTLQDYTELNFIVVTRTEQATGPDLIARETVLVDLASNADWADDTKTDAERLAALALMLNTALTDHGFEVVIVDDALQITVDLQDNPGTTLGLLGGTKTVDVLGTPQFDDALTLSDLGFGPQTLTDTQGVATEATFTQTLSVADTSAATKVFKLTDINMADLSEGLEEATDVKITYVLKGNTRELMLTTPVGGWFSGGQADLDGLVSATNAAFMDAKIPVTAALESGTNKLTYTLNTAPLGTGYSFTITALPAVEELLQLAEPVVSEFIPGADFDQAMVGVMALRYIAIVDGETIDLVIHKPDVDGWYLSGGAPNLSGMIDAFNAAFLDQGLPIVAGLNATSNGIEFSAAPGTTAELSFGIDPDKLTRATDLDTLIEWVNVRLNDLTILEGAELKLTEEGKLMFVFPSLENDFDASTVLSTDALDAGLLTNLSLEARLAIALNAKFDAAIGIDLLGFAADLIGASDDNILAAKAAAKADAAADADATIDPDDTALDVMLDAVLDNVIFTDLALTVNVAATVTGFTGLADLGLMALQIGGDTANLNFITLAAQMDVTLVGRNDTDGFVNDVSLRNLVAAVTYKDPVTQEYDSLRGLNGLIGRTDFQGAIVTDGAGQALASNGAAVTTAAGVQIVDVNDYELQDGETLSMLHIYLGDVALDTLGITDLNKDFIDGVSIVIDDLGKPVDTLTYKLLGDGAESVEALANLGQGDIFDSFAAIANMLQVLGNSLKEKLPFLDETIPLLNFSLLDAVDFAKDFSDALIELRNNPAAGLARADAYLEQYFGKDSVTLTWDTDAKTLIFALNLEFLRDYSEELAFNFDLDALLGDALKDMVGETVADLVTGLVDVAGDGRLVFDPDLTLNFTFGIDLSNTLKPATELATDDTLLSDLTTVGTISQSDRSTAAGTPDFQIRWKDNDQGKNELVRIDIDGMETLGALVAKISDAIADAFGPTVTFEYDPDTGVISLSDSNAELFDYDDVNALFGGDEVISEAGTAVGGFTPQILDLVDGFANFADAFSFSLGFSLDDGETFDGEGVLVQLTANTARSTATAFADALNTAFAKLDIPRTDINANAVPGWTIALSQILTATVDGGKITLQTTNFTDAIGADPVVFGVTGIDVSHDVTFTLTELGGSNALELLGFVATGVAISGNVTSEVLTKGTDIGAPRVYLDTEASGILLEMTAGAPDGLNLKLGLGPIALNVVDGTAQLTAGAGETGPAFLGISFVDVDEDAFIDQYDLSDLFNIIGDDARSFADVLALDIGIGIDVSLPFQDSLGLFNPDEHGLTYTTDLVTTDGPVVFSDIDLDALDETFSGDLLNIYKGDPLEGDFELNLPDLSDFLSNFNVLAFLNDPRAVLDGLDLILDQMQTLFDEYLSQIKLPIVGDAISASVSFFNDFRYNVIEKARVIAETPKPDGELPTTIDLLTGWLNTELNKIFNAGNTPIQFIQAYLNTEGTVQESYLYGAINFSAKIFDEMLDIALDLGIPGFDLEVKDGSAVRLTLDYTVNLGFGIDSKGFFLLNDTKAKEISIEFTADAGSFEGSMKLLNVLGVKAEAVDFDDDGEVINLGDGQGFGTMKLVANLGADLFGDDGFDIVDGDADDDEVAMDLSGIDPRNGAGGALDFEKVVYITQMDTSKLIAFSFNANVDINIRLEANILDPTTGQPIQVNGFDVVPSALTEVVFRGHYDSDEHDLGFQIEKLTFENVRVDISGLYDAVIKPVIDPIKEFIDPIADALAWMNEAPFSYIKDILDNAFPIFGMVSSIAETITAINNFVEEMDRTGGQFIFGDFDFTDAVQDGGKVEASKANVDTSGKTTPTGQLGNPFGVFGNTQRGFSIEIPLLTDPFSAINLLTGEFDKVDLIKVNVTLLNFNLPRTDLVQVLLDAIDAPDWVNDIIRNILEAEVEARAILKFTMGYDLGGIVNFVNSLDPERLLDGIFFDSAPGSLIDIFFGFRFRLDAGIAGLSGGAHAGLQLAFNDPNDDGKLRIPELLAIFDAIADQPEEFFNYMFTGQFDYAAKLDFWAGIRLPWPLPDLTFEATVFDLADTIPLGGGDIPAKISQDVDDGETAILNIGARAGANMTSNDEDGDDTVVIRGPNSPIQVNVTNEFGTITGEFNAGAGGLIIPAGEGNNTINLSALTFGKPVVVYTGGGTDTIILPNSGLNVIFAGNGTDRITQTGASTGTYVIFGQGGADTVNIENGNVICFGDADFGMRDRFMTKFASGGLSDAEVRDLLGLNADNMVAASGIVAASGGKYNATNADGAAAELSLTALLARYTELTQLSAATSVETVTAGAGNHVILTGRGVDLITTTGITGIAKIYSGDGADRINAGGADLYIEAGAGSDRIYTSAVKAEVWGWGKAAGEAGTGAGTGIDALSQRDGADLMVGGTGDDKFYGQIGNDLIEGNAGNDTMVGGSGIDLMTGGTFAITRVSGGAVDLTNFNPSLGFGGGINVSVRDLADGDDSLVGGILADILIGGGGNDTVDGGDSADAVIGDFAIIRLSANLVAEDIQTEYDISGNAGTDNLLGGLGNDILIAGGSSIGFESIIDLEGSNVALGDFGKVTGARLSEAVTLVESFSSPQGGRDQITLGNGNDIALGGEGDDTITMGLGGDIVVSDLGKIDITTRAITGTGTVIGNDVISFGAVEQFDVADIAIAGLGNDVITARSGGLFLLGDNGEIKVNTLGLSALRNYSEGPSAASARDMIAKMVDSIVSANLAADGDDTVTMAENGFLRGAIGGGDDTVELSSGISYVLADDGTLTLTNTTTTSTAKLVSAQSLNAGDDRITSYSTGDMIVGGAGRDSIALGYGDDVVLGDGGTIEVRTVSGVTTTTVTTDTDAFGNDTVTSDAGASGAKTVLLGLGNDTANLGDTGSLVLGDNGQATLTGGAWVANTSGASGGNDIITTGSGIDIILAGLGNDTVAAGDGANVIIADTGRFTNGNILSNATATDGADSITAGTGKDRVILGGGGDVASLGDGDNRVIGDSGEILYSATESVIVLDPTQGGADSITTGSGSDIILGAFEADTIFGGDGDNLVLGDTGSVVLDAAGRATMIGQDTLNGGVDVITTGTGRDAIVAGLGGDSVISGAGDDAILGDLGQYLAAQGGSNGILQSLTTTPVIGDDTISSGTGDDMVIAGLGDDTVNAGEGEDLIMGDNAYVTFAGNADIAVLEIRNTALGGNDLLITQGAVGDDIVVAQVGADDIRTAGGDDLIVADLARILLSDPRAALAGQSAADRLVVLDGIESSLGFDDTITAGDGRDIVWAGFGADSVLGGNGQDIIIGDSAILTRGWTVLPGGAVYEKFSIDSNFAFLSGGLDSIAGEDGPDIIIGGLDKDLFFSNTEDDLLFGDSYAGIFNSTDPLGFLAEPGAKRTMLTSNFAGPGAIDVVSESQQNASIGNSLDLIVGQDLSNLIDLAEIRAEAEAQDLAQRQAQTSQGPARDDVETIFEILGSQDVLRAVAELIAAGAGQELISAALKNYLIDSGVLSQNIDPIQLEVILNAIVAQMTKSAMAETNLEAQGSMRIAAE